MFGGSDDTRYTAEDIVRVANQTCACDLRPFFEAHVFGTEVLPIDTIVERLGYALSGDAVALTGHAEPAGMQVRELREAWLGGWRIPGARN